MSMWSSHIFDTSLFSLNLPALVGREEGENEEDGGQPNAGGAGEGDNKAGGSNAAAAGDDKGESQGDPQKKISAQDEIIARKQRQLDEQTTELEDLRKYRETAENAKLSEKERIDKRIEELEGSNTAKDAALQKLVLHNSFLASNDVQWHDAETALSLLDTSGFEIVVDEKTGIPAVKDKDAFKKAIAKLAADKPYLVKTPAEDGGDSGKGPKEWKGKTGETPKPKDSEESAERQRLLRKFPALRR